MKKKLIFTVTNQLTYDQRMQRICSSLQQVGYEVWLVGWRMQSPTPLPDMPFQQFRIRVISQKGKLRYVEYNLRLFFFLLMQRCDLICAIDLDTILPCYLAAGLRGKPIVYDAHEYFTELEEVVRRPLIKRVWKWIEGFTVPKIKFGYAVCQSYVDLFRTNYGVDYEIIRNATVLRPLPTPIKVEPYILYQGSVNEGRGLKPLLEAMQHVNAKLIVCGQGDLYVPMKAYALELGLSDKVEFKGYVEPSNLKAITEQAAVGITLFETNGKSNYYSLANRFFDYLHSGVPQLCNNYPEYISINSEFEIATLIDDLKPETIAKALQRLLNDADYHNRLKQNCMAAREKYCWQNEEKKLIAFYKNILG